MTENINKILDRGQRLEQLEDRSGMFFIVMALITNVISFCLSRDAQQSFRGLQKVFKTSSSKDVVAEHEAEPYNRIHCPSHYHCDRYQHHFFQQI